MTIDHFFKANYPKTIFAGSFCDISAFFNCDSSAFSSISQVLGIPLGFFGLFMGALDHPGHALPVRGLRADQQVALPPQRRSASSSLFLYSVLHLGSLCLLCSGFYLFSILSFVLFVLYGIDRETKNPVRRWVRPSLKLLVVFAVVAAGRRLRHDPSTTTPARPPSRARPSTSSSSSTSCPRSPRPRFLSPYWSVKSTDTFEDAAIQVIEYTDFVCPDCLYLSQQLERLKKDFAGKINVAIQFFPLEGLCNEVVPEKANLHPGACEMTYIAAGNPGALRRDARRDLGQLRLAQGPGLAGRLRQEVRRPRTPRTTPSLRGPRQEDHRHGRRVREDLGQVLARHPLDADHDHQQPDDHRDASLRAPQGHLPGPGRGARGRPEEVHRELGRAGSQEEIERC
ncbi:MAG: thioredoxin domain-containing protein [Anaerotruncus sp.]|nr:thioredoxin domain-containing protein [Anaerotruncus sp.]